MTAIRYNFARINGDVVSLDRWEGSGRDSGELRGVGTVPLRSIIAMHGDWETDQLTLHTAAGAVVIDFAEETKSDAGEAIVRLAYDIEARLGGTWEPA